MKLTKGTLKVIIGDPAACEENDRRASVGGRIFIPPYVVLEYSEDVKALDVHRAFCVNGKTVRPRTVLGRFPYEWAPTAFKSTRLWAETRDELFLQTSFKDTNGED